MTGRPVCSASMQAWICIERSSRPPKAPPTPARVIRTRSGGRPRLAAIWCAIDVQPLGGDVEIDAAVLARDRQARTRGRGRPGPACRARTRPSRPLGRGSAAATSPWRTCTCLRTLPPSCSRGSSVVDRAVHVDERLERLVVDLDRARPRGARSPGGRRPRSPPARPGSGPRRSRARAGRAARGRRSCGPGTSSWVRMACTPGSASAAAKSIERIAACGCGLRRVVPHSIPSAHRSDEYANSPFTLSLPSGRSALSPMPSRIPGDRTSAVPVALTRSPSRCEPHRVEDLLVAGAAAEVAGERLADLGLARRGVAREQVVRRHDQARRAEAALHRARLEEGLLDRMETRPRRRQALDGHDRRALGLAREHEARAHQRPVQVHRAGAALALLAGVLRARQAHPLAQHVQQALALPDVVDLRGARR